MKFALVYVSPNGTTRKTTELLAEEIRRDGNDVELFDIGRKQLRFEREEMHRVLKSKDLVGFGSPVYHMDILGPMEDVLKNARGSFKAFIYLNYGGITTGKAFLNAAKLLEDSNISVVGGLKVKAPHFHHDEKFPTEDTFEVIKDFYSGMKISGFGEMERIYKKFKPEKKRVYMLYPLAHIIGKRRELPITTDQDKCKKCRKCANECPVGAISLDGEIKTDFGICIHCYHCTVACAFGAMDCPVGKLDKMIRVNKRIIGTESPPDKKII